MEKKIAYLTRAPIIINQFLIFLVDYSNQINICCLPPLDWLFEWAWPKVWLGVAALPALQSQTIPDGCAEGENRTAFTKHNTCIMYEKQDLTRGVKVQHNENE